MFTWPRVKARVIKRIRRPTNSTYHTHKEIARAEILSRLQAYNHQQDFVYHRVAIRDQRRCWGSCSSKGNLNFSYKLLFLPPCLRDYVIVHELCHLKVLNHSAEFWAVVATYMPDYAERKHALRHLEKTIGTSIVALKKYQASHRCMSCEQGQELLK